MARRRMIDPGIWQSQDFSDLSILARLVFIGLFSNADDEGKGRAKPVYVKSIIFPYDEDLRVSDIEKALSEIGSKMSVTFYTHDGSEYYCLNSWLKWQRVDKPQPSKIPNPESFQNHSRMILVSLSPKGKEVNIKEENISEKNSGRASRFAPPALEEVKTYCQERNNGIDPKRFIDYYTANGWVQGKGKPIKDWKAAVRTWERNTSTPQQGQKSFAQLAAEMECSK